MKASARWLYAISAVAMAFVAVSAIVAAVREDSWGPLVAVGWLPAVVAAAWWPGTRRRCAPWRHGSPG